MSRIHDALRRGRAPADEPNPGRAAHADSVLAALGYKSDKPRAARAALKLLGVLVVVLLIGAWFVLPSWRELFPARLAQPPARTVAQNPPPPANVPAPAVSDPAKKPESNPPAVSDPAKKPESNPPAPPPAPVVAALPPRATPPPVSPKPSSAAPTTGSTSNPTTVRLPQATKADEFQLALYYQRSGDFEQALLHYRAALQRDEMNIEAHNNLGHLYLGKGLFDDAAREFQRVIAIDPKYTTARINLSAANYSLGKFDAAAAEARIALSQQPRNPDALVNLALAQQQLGQGGDAQASLRRALEIDPRNASAHYNLARQFEEAGEAAAAIGHYNKFIQYASPEQAAYAADVRARLAVLAARTR